MCVCVDTHTHEGRILKDRVYVFGVVHGSNVEEADVDARHARAGHFALPEVLRLLSVERLRTESGAVDLAERVEGKRAAVARVRGVDARSSIEISGLKGLLWTSPTLVDM